MSEPFFLNIDNQERIITPDLARIVMFRKEADDLDYLEVEEDRGSEAHRLWVFSNRELLIWMGGVAVKRGDDKTLRLANRTHGSFEKHVGWRPDVEVHDHATEVEMELFTLQAIKKLREDLERGQDE